jgi:hypothetical protein
LAALVVQENKRDGYLSESKNNRKVLHKPESGPINEGA